jgi:hypothetical protein
MGRRETSTSTSGETPHDDESDARLNNIRANQRFALTMQLARVRGLERVTPGTVRTAGTRRPRFTPAHAFPRISNVSPAALCAEEGQDDEIGES